MNPGGLPSRRGRRIAGHDYAAPATYHVVLTVRDRRPFFGEVDGAGVRLTEAGEMVRAEWVALPSRFTRLELDEHVVMPDHLHGIVSVPDASGFALTDVIRVFKSRTTLRYIYGVREQSWPPFERQLWQRSFHDRGVRDEEGLRQMREYIRTNPIRWTARRQVGDWNVTP